VLIEKSFEKFEAIFTGAGETLAATLAALVAHGTDLVAATDEALLYLDQSLNAGFRPGMGHVIPDRMFWATPDESENDEGTSDTPASRLQ
jgi:hydroxymethylpyrimidine/phosphomethylpyrimidine kinase